MKKYANKAKHSDGLFGFRCGFASTTKPSVLATLCIRTPVMKNILSEIKHVNERWDSIGIGEVNGSPVSIRVMEDVEANFHTHENADEFFLVLSGKVFIDTDSESIELNQGQSHTVAAGTKHRARAIGRSELIVIGGQDA